MAMPDLPNQHYHAYLLRIWHPAPEADWRIMLEAIPTREQFGFSELAALAAFLEEREEEGGSDER